MDEYVCRGCGEADDIANITPTIRPVTSIRIEDGALTAELGNAEEVDDSYDGFVWQCQGCGTEGHSLEDVLEAA